LGKRGGGNKWEVHREGSKEKNEIKREKEEVGRKQLIA
jgi:hypothetical protein